MRGLRFQFIFALCFGAAVTLLSWLLISPGSPIESSSEALKYDIALIQVFALYPALTLSGNPHLGSVGLVIYWVLVFAQWFLVGLGISLVGCGLSFLFRMRGRRDAA